MALINQGAPCFPYEGEKRILEAVFAFSPITTIEVGLFSSITGAPTDDAAVTYSMLSLITPTGTDNAGSAAKTITNTTTATDKFAIVTPPSPITGNASIARGTPCSFSNSGSTTWTSNVGGFYIASVTGTTRTLLMFQTEPASVMTVASTYDITLNISLN